MIKSILTRRARITWVAVALATVGAANISAQTQYEPAVYPMQQESVGAASLTETTDNDATRYTLSNNLFQASFKKQGNSILFDGCEAMDLQPGTEIFTVKLGNGSTVVNASEMVLKELTTGDLVGKTDAVKGAHHFDGKYLQAIYGYTYSGADITFTWRAELRDGSHYLRTDLTMTSTKNVKFSAIVPMQYNVDVEAAGSTPSVSGNTRGSVLVSNKIFAGLETPTGYNTAGSESDLDRAWTTYNQWNGAASFNWTPSELPTGMTDTHYNTNNIVGARGYLKLQGGSQTITFTYSSGSHKLNIAGVDVVDPVSGAVVASDYHNGRTGNSSENNVYRLNIPENGVYIVRYFISLLAWSENYANETITSSGNITYSKKPEVVTDFSDFHKTNIVPIQGLWSRDANLLAYDASNIGKDMVWNVSAVIGLVNPQHIRRSILAYSERERAVPWRPFPLYNSWYELTINHNNFQDPSQNMKIEDCTAVVSVWKEKLYDQYGVGIKSFAWDDGWDQYGTWEHHASFPNGFKECGQEAALMNSGTGAWLGPVGGYGTSGTYRRNYWNGKGGMQLSNPTYYNVFKNACVRLVQAEPERDGYEFNFFKFDGISAQFSAVGPDDGSVGNENAEGIITCERYVRENVKEDIFFNTSVGTWASPFWFHFSDAVWRQEKDYGEIGVGTSREKWITYRDRLVYQNFVQNAPYCPINTLMTHGFIYHSGDGVSSNLDYAGALRELRCAFACGSGMVELYADHSLLTNTNGGKLWKDLADCIKWQEENRDVLPDIHWVGGNPWTGSKAEIYGWAAWNGTKAVLTLRNGATARQSYNTTLRDALDIPQSFTGKVTLSAAFDDQKGSLKTLCGKTEGEEIDVDEMLTFSLPASSVYVFNGKDADAETAIETVEQSATRTNKDKHIYDLSGRQLSHTTHGVNIVSGKKILR